MKNLFEEKNKLNSMTETITINETTTATATMNKNTESVVCNSVQGAGGPLAGSEWNRNAQIQYATIISFISVISIVSHAYMQYRL